MDVLPWLAALVGTILLWVPSLEQLPQPLWPSLLATVGVWLLAALWGLVRGRSRRR